MTRIRLMTTIAGLAAGALAGLASAGHPVLMATLHTDEAAEGTRHAEAMRHAEAAHARAMEAHRAATEAVRRAQARSGAPEDTTFEMVTHEGDDKYEIVVRGEKVSATVNGMKVADDLVVRDGDTVRILDDDGAVIREFRIGRALGKTGDLRVTTGRFPGGTWAQAPGVMRFGLGTDNEELQQAIAAERPPVMLGVLLESASPVLQAQLGVSEFAIVLEEVMEGLPADKAGLEAYDIIVSVNGDAINGPAFLRDILMESKPGDELELVVLRGGKKIERTLELEAYDAGKLSSGGPTVTGSITIDDDFPLNLKGQAQNEEQRRAIDEMMQKLAEVGALRDNEEAMRAIREELAKIQERIGPQIRELETLRGQFGTGRGGMLFDNGRLIIPDAQREELETRLDALEGEFDERLDALEERMEDRWAKMEGVFDRLFTRVEELLEKTKKSDD